MEDVISGLGPTSTIELSTIKGLPSDQNIGKILVKYDKDYILLIDDTFYKIKIPRNRNWAEPEVGVEFMFIIVKAGNASQLHNCSPLKRSRKDRGKSKHTADYKASSVPFHLVGVPLKERLSKVYLLSIENKGKVIYKIGFTSISAQHRVHSIKDSLTHFSKTENPVFNISILREITSEDAAFIESTLIYIAKKKFTRAVDTYPTLQGVDGYTEMFSGDGIEDWFDSQIKMLNLSLYI